MYAAVQVLHRLFFSVWFLSRVFHRTFPVSRLFTGIRAAVLFNAFLLYVLLFTNLLVHRHACHCSFQRIFTAVPRVLMSTSTQKLSGYPSCSPAHVLLFFQRNFPAVSASACSCVLANCLDTHLVLPFGCTFTSMYELVFVSPVLTHTR